MKRIAFFLAALILLLAALPVQAETWYVYTANGKTLNLRSPKDNSVIGSIPYGTRLETDDDLSTETAAYVTYKGVSGYVKWEFLVKDPPPARNGNGKQTEAAPSNPLTADGSGEITIQAFGAYIEYAGGPDGKYSAVSYDDPREIIITADLNGKRPAYWVIDGVRYDFEDTVPKSLTIDNAQSSMTIEAVAKNGASQTLLSSDAIQAARTGETLIAKTVNAKLCHLTAKGNGKGGWMDSFDFTDDYKNLATNKKEAGGQLTTRVRASVPKNQKIAYWKFDDMKIAFSTNVTQFVVRTLNVSKTYEPVFGSSASGKAKASPTPATAYNTRPSAPTATPATSYNTRPSAPTATPATSYNTRPSAPTATPATSYNTRPSAPVTVYSVSCSGCTFSGGGYTRASSGTVAAGTSITVYAQSRSVSKWVVNGATRVIDRSGTPDTGVSFTMTVNRNVSITCNYR